MPRINVLKPIIPNIPAAFENFNLDLIKPTPNKIPSTTLTKKRTPRMIKNKTNAAINPLIPYSISLNDMSGISALLIKSGEAKETILKTKNKKIMIIYIHAITLSKLELLFPIKANP